ncbi:glycoside hydrolase family 17 protein [Parathielavia hyrcaniae]|uniref:Probable glucan endo-1,3-beta-glucosidase eglC n=1 Tax=Parathielavia hyrcaniae TaxID=113614 RepID=A0AAN6Q4M9_9PEZI|nr:glycoside hydrolase family 17 protein [Parathielavia hyrcaniae]
MENGPRRNQRHPRRHSNQHDPPPRHLVLRRPGRCHQRTRRPQDRHRHLRRGLHFPRGRHLGRQRGHVPHLPHGQRAPFGRQRRRGRLRETVKGTPLEKTPVGHVDTWTEWTRSASQPVLDAVDWVGVDAYSYWQDLVPNGVAEGKHLFDEAMGTMTARVGAKPVWITETGFPVSGGVSGDAVPSVEGARQFWAEVGCPLFGTMNVWWYTLRDAPQKPGTPSFGILGANLTQPLFDISCKGSAQAEPEDDACDAV